jgi:16S rRNA (guanine527-N7)-methyltransferase
VEVPKVACVIDVGTGAGMPGIPLKIVRPDLRVTLLDSTAKKLTFCDAVISDLGLVGIGTVHGRAEELARRPEYGRRYDLATARAVASLDKLLPWCAPFVRAGGRIIALKGPAVLNELEAASPVARRLRMTLDPISEISLPDLSEMEDRRIVVANVR